MTLNAYLILSTILFFLIYFLKILENFIFKSMNIIIKNIKKNSALLNELENNELKGPDVYYFTGESGKGKTYNALMKAK